MLWPIEHIKQYNVLTGPTDLEKTINYIVEIWKNSAIEVVHYIQGVPLGKR